MILDDIVAKRREQLAREMELISLDEIIKICGAGIESESVMSNRGDRIEVDLEIKTRAKPKLKRFYNAIKCGQLGRLAIISEVKKASPSKGIIKEDFNPVEIAVTYENAGAEAISVLTEEYYFKGCSQYLKQIKQAISIPILRKDFIIDEYQIYEAKAIGADAILLIVAILNKETLEKFLALAAGLQLDCLVEVHDKMELEIAISCGAGIIGINNRNLKTFEVSLETTKRLVSHIPDKYECLVVSESGISTNNDMKELKACGANAVLVGETLMRSGNVKETLNALRCGI